ncbi:MAG: DsrE family protein [Erysipelotrichaceae bacterium]
MIDLEKVEVSVVFHLSQKIKAEMTFKNILNLIADESVTVSRVALVINGPAILLCTPMSDHYDDLLELIARNVDVNACRNAMKSHHISEADLIEGILSVPSGVGQLAKLQTLGYAYIKA